MRAFLLLNYLSRYVMDFDFLLQFMNFKFLLDMLPVGLACYALIKLYKVKHNSLLIVLSKSSAVLLIICQLSWIHSYLNHFSLVTSFFDNVWSIFNSIVMLMVLVVAEKESKNYFHRDCLKCSSFTHKQELIKIMECNNACNTTK